MVSAGPDQYLLVGRGGRLENRGSAVSTYLRPGSIFVLVPSTKQEAAFEFTQETKDGIPLRFKGIIIFRITDPVIAARQFDFSHAGGLAQITTLLTHICLGELRHAVSGMSMAECIEQRKTTLTGLADAALQSATHGSGGGANEWGITVELAQVAQVFIVDAGLRQQLEAEVRNEIKLKSDQSDIRATEETRLAQMASAGRVEELKLANDREALRRQEELELAQLARERRMSLEELADERGALELEQERFHAKLEVDRDRATAEAPVRRLRLEKEAEVLRDELEVARLRNEARALEVEHELLLVRAQQALRREILPLEQAPRMVEAASRVLQGTNLSLYGDDARLVGQLSPILELLAGSVRRAMDASSDEAVPDDVPA